MTKKIFIAGVCGFIPGHLAEFYLKEGLDVYGMDNFITGDRKTLEILRNYKNFYFKEGDICTTSFFEDVSFDVIAHMASPASPIDFPKIPLEIMQVNSLGTHKLLERAKKDTSIYLEASTSEVYGDPEVHPQVETYVGHVNPIGPRSCYDESKRFAEAMTMTYKNKYNVNTRIIRIFNTYGPRMRPNDGRVIPNFINQALKNEDITVYGTGEQTRSFCFVDDLVRAIDSVIKRGDHNPYNIGNPGEYKILDVATMIIESLGSKSNRVFMPLPKDDPKRRRPNIDRLLSLGYDKNQKVLHSGLNETSNYFKGLQ